jgi:hypothetical protein
LLSGDEKRLEVENPATEGVSLTADAAKFMDKGEVG